MEDVEPIPRVRAEWLMAVVSRCQAFAGRILVCEPEDFVGEAERLARDLPEPQTIVERATLGRLLLEAGKGLWHTAEYRGILARPADVSSALPIEGCDGRTDIERFIDCARAVAAAAASEVESEEPEPDGERPRDRPDLGHAVAPHLDLHQVATYIDHHCDKALTARALGQVFGYDPRRLARAFRTRFDTSLYERVHRARILKGLRLLRRTTANVADVARAVGFCSKATFYRAVMRATGQTPAQYRKLARPRAPLRSR